MNNAGRPTRALDAPPGGDGPRRWNHNIHYHGLVLEAVPPGAKTALDVGTGDGLLAVDLLRVVPNVTAMDVDPDVLQRARLTDGGVTWVCGDVLDPGLSTRFDVVASIATLHHLPCLATGLRRLADLTAPGGTLVIVGLARTTRTSERLLHVAGAVQHRWMSMRHGFWEHSAPKVAHPSASYSDVRACAGRVLPGCRFRLLPLWRYVIVWRRSVDEP